MDENKVEYLYGINILYKSSRSHYDKFQLQNSRYKILFFDNFIHNSLAFYKLGIVLNDPPTIIQFKKNKNFLLNRFKKVG